MNSSSAASRSSASRSGASADVHVEHSSAVASFTSANNAPPLSASAPADRVATIGTRHSSSGNRTSDQSPSSSLKQPSRGSIGSTGPGEVPRAQVPSSSRADKAAGDAVGDHVRSESTLPYSHEEIERVRQALAAAGYPTPGADDIERVFQHVRAELERQQHEASVSQPLEPRGGTRERSTSSSSPSDPRRRRSQPQQRPRQPWDASVPMTAPRYQGPRTSVDRSEPYGRAGARAEVPLYYRQAPPHASAAPLDPRHPALYLNPAVRLERYMRRYERDLADYYHYQHGSYDESSGPYGPGDDQGWPQGEANRYGPEAPLSAPPQQPYQQQYQQQQPAQAQDFQASHVLTAPLEEVEDPYGASPGRPVDAAVLRRSANTVFNMTGDERYRYRPPMPRPRSAAPPYGSAHAQPPYATRRGSHATVSSTVPMASTCFNAERLPPRPRTSRLLSTHTVSYLQPDGSTLRTKADPVKRGNQMRELWSQDPFLSQRGWSAERWQTRQATMNYDDAA